MNIFQLSINDLKGKRFNGYALHQQLLAQDHTSAYYTWWKESKSDTTHSLVSEKLLPYRLRRIVSTGISGMEYLLSLQSILSPFSRELVHKPDFLTADIVHFHLLYPGYFNLHDLPIISHNKPVVWTIHDMWPFTGHCVHAFDCEKWQTGCGHCPYLQTNFATLFDNTRLNWKIKQWVYNHSNLTLVVASQWMKEKVKASPLLSRFPIHLIPFGIDVGIYKPQSNHQARKSLGIPEDAVVVGFRASPIAFKGFDLLKQALHQLKNHKNVYLLAFDQKSMLGEFDGKFKYIEVGWIDNDAELVNLFNICDFFVMPSTAESFGMMTLEAMACGKPVIACSGTAISEVISAPNGGLLVPQDNYKALAETMDSLIGNKGLRRTIGTFARKRVENEYSFVRYTKNHLALYNKILSQENQSLNRKSD